MGSNSWRFLDVNAALKHQPSDLLIVEEFFPISSTLDMEAVAFNASTSFKLSEIEANSLRRHLVWMRKYIAPTSEFWEWPPISQRISNTHHLTIRFIGIGWIVAINGKINAEKSLVDHEKDSIRLLESITGDIPTVAVARLKSGGWNPQERRRLRNTLRNSRVKAKIVHKTELRLHDTNVSISLNTAEEVTLRSASRTDEMIARGVLLELKSWANAQGRLQGADWCAFGRRRLTKLVRISGSISPDTVTTGFIWGHTAGFVGARTDDYDEVSLDLTSGSKWGLQFPNLPYHQGVVHPRCGIYLKAGESNLAVKVGDYVSYLWANHYTRIKAYLEYEDQFAYATTMRRVKALDDPSVYSFGRKSLSMEGLRNEVDFLNRVDRGAVSSYIPPHGIFTASKSPGSEGPIWRLRHQLIPHSSVNQLRTDPLATAADVLFEATNEIARMHALYSSVASLKMQRSLHILQVVFVVAAVTQVLSLVDLAHPIDRLFSQSSFFVAIGSWCPDFTNFVAKGPFDLSLVSIQILLISILSCLALLVVDANLRLRGRRSPRA